MGYPERHFQWIWRLQAAPPALWPLVSDTDRFNRDCGFPAVTVVPPAIGPAVRTAGTRRLRTRHFGLGIEWDEHRFEWVAPRRFGVVRDFHRGPFASIRAVCELTPDDQGGTTIQYQVWFRPANLLGRLALAFGGAYWQFGRPFGRVFSQYDRQALSAAPTTPSGGSFRLGSEGARRLRAIKRELVDNSGQSPVLVDRLTAFLVSGDPLTLQRIRAYSLADWWQQPRREVLHLLLHGTHVGLLDFSWDLLCPHCRGAKAVADSLDQLKAQAHCDTCQIDFTADFEHSVELTFRPNAAIRPLPRTTYCVGGPQVTPHIVAQQAIAASGRQPFTLDLHPGRYRVRSSRNGHPRAFRVEPAGAAAGCLQLDPTRDSADEIVLAPEASLTVENQTGAADLAVIEHVAWSDQATMASEVTSLQLFRDLFTRELLRPGERITVGHLTIAFTDLKGSTQLYREIGDAPAFGRVLTHFDILRTAVDAEGGAIVKTMGDAIMAVFPRPLPALRALLVAQHQLRLAQSAMPWKLSPVTAALSGPLALKAGIHTGPCIAITQNSRLDYFGTTVNVAARLCALSTGADLVISAAARQDPELDEWVERAPSAVSLVVEQTPLRGFAGETFQIARVTRASLRPSAPAP